MANASITTATSTNVAGPCRTGAIQINNDMTGTITVVDNTTGSTPVIAIITNPTKGQRYEYWNFVTGFRLVTSAVCDITGMSDGAYGEH